MKRLGRLLLGIVTVAATGIAPMAESTAQAATGPAPAATVRWTRCPTYDEAFIKKAARDHDLRAFRKQLARRECGTVSVPVDYARPTGRRLRVAITRFRATDPRLR